MENQLDPTLDIIFVDSSVDNYQSLIDGIVPQSSGGESIVGILNSNQNGIEQISDYLEKYTNEVAAVHIISHGNPGSLQLGNVNLDSTNIFSYRDELINWGYSLTDDADILLYGCNVAATNDELLVMNQLSDITSADIAASDDLTGSSLLGGDWELEVANGSIETSIVLDSWTQNNYDSLLLNDVSLNTKANTISFTGDGSDEQLYRTVTDNIDVQLGDSNDSLIVDESFANAIALERESDNSTTSIVGMVDTSVASTEVNVKVNFQPGTYETPAGYIPDSGFTYGQQYGYTFGWNNGHEECLRDRSGFNNDLRLASHVSLKSGALWEMAVPNGKYHVRVATGEAKFPTQQNTINIEGKNYWNFQYLNENEFGYINAQIEVTDGRLSIDNGSAPEKTTKIAYLEIIDDVAPERSPDIDMKFNFQAASFVPPDNYIRDKGEVYGSRDGATFGWNIDHTDYGRDRTGYNTDSRRASNVVVKPGGVWEVALPNGEYHVSVTIGDARYSASNNVINVEESNYWSDLSLDANQFATKVRTVSVNDGKLTIDNGNAADIDTNIAYLHIASGDAPIEYDFPSDINQLPLQPGHPDPFLNVLKDERLPSVPTTAEWEAHRDYLKQLSAFYQYGITPPKPETYRVMSQSTKSVFGNAAIEDLYKITLERNGIEQSFEYGVIRPNREGNFPVVIKNDRYRFDYDEIASVTKRQQYSSQQRLEKEMQVFEDAIGRGYAMVKFNRDQVSKDRAERNQDIFQLYPEQKYTFGVIAAWAFSNQIVIDHLLESEFVDASKIVTTGHSRGGKTALVTGIYDDRVAAVVPNASGSGGTGSWKFFNPNPPEGLTEGGLSRTKASFPMWYEATGKLWKFEGNEDYLPFDGVTNHVLLAPRFLMNTLAIDDTVSDSYGSQVSFQASEAVFAYLGVESHHGIHFRPGSHQQDLDDWYALLDFCDESFFSKPHSRDFKALNWDVTPEVYWDSP